MRKGLAKSADERKRFRAQFVRLGKKTNFKGYSEDTLLLREVKDVESGKVVADHVWFTFSKGFEAIPLTVGTLIEFDARIKKYEKGYVNKSIGLNKRQTDYKLSHPTKIKAIPSELPARAAASTSPKRKGQTE